MTHSLEVNSLSAASCPAGDALAGQPLVAATSGRQALAITSSALQAAAMGWFVVAVLGQSTLVVCLFGFYGRTAFRGQFERWNNVLTRDHVAGDTAGNLVVSMHMAFAALINVGGLLQLTTGVRRLFPTSHRWSGRAYPLSACVMSLGGLVMMWTGAAREICPSMSRPASMPC